MTSRNTECTPKSYPFGRLNGRPIVTDFKGATMTQNGGLILISELDRQLGVSQRLADWLFWSHDFGNSHRFV